MSAPTLLMINAFIGTASYKKLYTEIGYQVVTEWSERKAIALIRKSPPSVIVADFFHQSDFRDRLSNLESVLATAQASPATKILVFYEPAHLEVLDRVAERLRVDVGLAMPVDEDALRHFLTEWLPEPAWGGGSGPG